MSIIRKLHFLAVVFFILATFSFSMAVDTGKKTNRKPNTKPGDCRACHGKDSKLPDDHPDTKNMSIKDCKGCHEEKGKRLETKLLLSHFHNLAGVKCVDCHEAKKSKVKAEMRRCYSCHGSYEKLAELTKNADPNPHKSHQGKLDCNLCHHQHKKSVNYCGQCHEWPLDVP